jgi:tetratricopeptide (TPR) repeat protein
MNDVRRSRFWFALLGIGFVALVVRLAYLGELSGSPLVSVLMGDGRQYDEWAVRIASGQWLGAEVFYQSPLYPYALAVIYLVAGHDPAVVRLVQAVLGSAACVWLGLAGRGFFSERVGLVAAMFLAIYPPAIFFDGLIQKSSLDIVLVTLVLALLARFRDRLDWKSLVGASAATALLVLNRENARLVFLVIGAWLLIAFREVPIRRRAVWAGVFLAASLAVLLPVGLRNYWVGGEFLLSTSQFGPNFYIGNNSHASGSYEPLVPGRGDPLYERADATRLASEASGRTLSPGEVSGYWVRRTFGDILGRPLGWLALFGKKLLLTVNAGEIPDTESIEAYADASSLLRGLLWLDFGVVFPLAVFGAWACRADWRRLAVLYALFTGLALSVAIFYVLARYRHPLVPVVLLFSAAGVAGIADAVRSRAWPRDRAQGKRERTADVRSRDGSRARVWLPGVAVALVAVVVAHLPMRVVQDETYLNLGSLLVQDGRAAEAIAILQKAIAVDPAYAAPHYQLALAFRGAGKHDEAIAELQAAIRLRPNNAEAHGTLGMELRSAGRTDEALAHFQEAARLSPTSVESRTNLGLALMEAGRTGEAVGEHRQAVALAPNSSHPHNNLAMALHQSGDTRQAIAEYQRALTLQPDYAEAHANLALTLASVRDYPDAVAHFAEAVRLQPDNYGVHIAFGDLLCETARTDEGAAQYDEAARLSPDAVEPWLLMSRAYAASRRFAEAAASLEKALSVATATGQREGARQIAASLQQARTMAARGNR